MTVLVPLSWPAAEVPGLPPGVFHVWSFSLKGAAADVLSADERERAGRFVSEHLTRRWSRGRAELRRILAAYAGDDPAGLAIEPAACVHCGEPHGKPALTDPAVGWLRFNISHSGDLAAVAVAHGREVGVDLEATREGRRLQGIADSAFNPAEAAALRRLEGADRQALFYRLWARKEAYLKATAEGVYGTLASFDALDPAPGDGWELADLDLGEEYAGAVAVAPPGFEPGTTAPAGGARRSR